MDASPVVNPPPPINLMPFPAATGVGFAVLFTIILLMVAARFDHTRGALTVSLLIVVGFLGTDAYCLIFTVPIDEVTPAVVGGLTAGFGAVVAYWLGRTQTLPPPGEAHDGEAPASKSREE